jgi:hypothetical protein
VQYEKEGKVEDKRKSNEGKGFLRVRLRGSLGGRKARRFA